MPKSDEQLYVVIKPKSTLTSRYYLGNEDGVWPAKLEQIDGTWKPFKTSSVMIPFYWVKFNITLVKPAGKKHDLRPVEDLIVIDPLLEEILNG